MAIAIYDKREFVDTRTQETIKYDMYGIVAIVDGVYTELRLKNLDAAEKLAFKMILTGSNPSDIETTTRAAKAEELENFKIDKKTMGTLEDDPNEKGLFD